MATSKPPIMNCACFACTYRSGDMDISEHTVYIVAADFAEAAQRFDEQRYWKWRLIKLERIGRALNGTFYQIVQATDWDLLREQKRDILALLDAPDTMHRESLTGILHLIDSLQDAVVDAKMKTEHEVFGTSINQDTPKITE